MMTQNLWDAAKAALQEVQRNAILPQGAGKHQMHNATLYLKQLGKEQKKTQSSQKEINHKDQSRNK